MIREETRLPGIFDWDYLLLCFSYFGFWDVNLDKDLMAKSGVKLFLALESITPTVLGTTLSPILLEARDLHSWNLPFRRQAYAEWNVIPGSPLPEVPVYESLWGAMEIIPKKVRTPIKVDKGKPGDPFFLPFVPLFAEGELQKTLPREGIKFVDGTYIFKVSLSKKLWRRVKMSADHTLLDLHLAIQKAYSFDNDHLYSFFMDNKLWSDMKFTDPLDDEGPYVDEVCIGELGLYEGQEILYLFDYGDMWLFRVELEKIDAEGPKPEKPQIIEKKGSDPEQYPEW
ncbi:MAG: plasmid pRiA4b ORF-3 family protein [Candidatus Freyarchaeota archaeon]